MKFSHNSSMLKVRHMSIQDMNICTIVTVSYWSFVPIFFPCTNIFRNMIYKTRKTRPSTIILLEKHWLIKCLRRYDVDIFLFSHLRVVVNN